MTTLEDAWCWCESARQAQLLLAAVGAYWERIPWDQSPRPPDRLKHTGTGDFQRIGDALVAPLDDLAILVLFSVFEANVRDIVEVQLRPEIDGLRHPALVKAGKDVLKAVEEGSFFQLLEPYKSQLTSDLVEAVNQVRRHRNWMAHGRQPDKLPPALVRPSEAYQRLRDFLGLLRAPTPTTS